MPDYDDGLAFFAGGLGWTVVDDRAMGVDTAGRPKRWVVVRPRGGGAALLLARADGARQSGAVGAAAGGRVAFFLDTDDFERDAARLRAAGAVFEAAPRDESYGRVAVWRDPWGNRWDLIERTRQTTA